MGQAIAVHAGLPVVAIDIALQCEIDICPYAAVRAAGLGAGTQTSINRAPRVEDSDAIDVRFAEKVRTADAVLGGEEIAVAGCALLRRLVDFEALRTGESGERADGCADEENRCEDFYVHRASSGI